MAQLNNIVEKGEKNRKIKGEMKKSI